MKHAINIIIASILTGGIGFCIGSFLASAVVGWHLDEYDTITDKDTAEICHLATRLIDIIT